MRMWKWKSSHRDVGLQRGEIRHQVVLKCVYAEMQADLLSLAILWAGQNWQRFSPRFCIGSVSEPIHISMSRKCKGAEKFWLVIMT